MNDLPPVKKTSFKHEPVLGDAVLNSTQNIPHRMLSEGLIIDATLGGGGHSILILNKHQNIRLIGLDQDPNAIQAATKNLSPYKNRIEIIKTNFSDFFPKEKASLVIADLGVSSPQLDVAERGFSFRLNGPLDMRMDTNNTTTAQSLINSLNECQLADLIYKYGEEKFSRRIARRIKLDLNEKGQYSGTVDLAYAIAGCYPPKQRYCRIHPATRTFQALRIGVNDELKSLEKFLFNATNWHEKGGILCIISFHSLEDRLVKYSFKEESRLIRLTKKPITAKEEDISDNPRSRSAKLRIAQRVN
mgnify:CR=1 FL=1